jgi:acid stress-induced BolA-like protein IbaG/YrbA
MSWRPEPGQASAAIYAHLNPWIADGSIHAVTMKFFSSAAWAERT